MLVSRGDVSCGEEKRGLSLRGEYGKLNRRIFKLASSIDSLQSAYIFNRHIFNRHIFNRHIFNRHIQWCEMSCMWVQKWGSSWGDVLHGGYGSRLRSSHRQVVCRWFGCTPVGRPDGVSCRMYRTARRLFRVDVSGGPRTTHPNRLLSSKNLIIKRDSVERIWLLMRVSALTNPAALYTGLEMIGPNGDDQHT